MLTLSRHTLPKSHLYVLGRDGPSCWTVVPERAAYSF
jgi:hypothetical protein